MLRRFLQLSRNDRGLLAEAAFRLILAWILLRAVPFRWLARSIRRGGGRNMTQAEVRKISWAVEAVANRFPERLSCLPRGFASAWMLQARGASPRMHYGVAHGTAGFESHVWVELEGLPVVGSYEAPGFTILVSFPS
jgi:hypothetical protein